MDCQMFPPVPPLHNGDVPVPFNESQQDLAKMEGLQPVPKGGSPVISYEDYLNTFTYDICGNLAYAWIGLFDPDLKYYGIKPVWWPKRVPWMNPRSMLKKDKVILLSHLLRGMLLEHCTRVSLEIEARTIYRLRSSPVHQKTLDKILDAFQGEQMCRNMPPYRTFPHRERRTLIKQIVDVNPISLGCWADLTSDFCVEWLKFSSQGVPLHAAAMTRCALRGRSLISLEGPTLQYWVAEAIEADSRMGNLKLVVTYNPSPLGPSVPALSYMAFSIRIAVSLQNGRIEKAIARGWEDIPSIIAEIETQCSATTAWCKGT